MSDLDSSDPDDRVWRRFAHVWAWLVIVVLIVIAVGLTFSPTASWINERTAVYLQSVGGSLLASIMVYTLVTLFLEPKQRAVQARLVSKYAVRVAHEQFKERFETSLPEAVFRETDTPSSAFREAFVRLLRESSRYEFKGGSASFTVFRLAVHKRHPDLRRLEEVRLCLTDPRDAPAVEAHAMQLAQLPGGTERTRDALVDQVKLDLAVSLVALFDIRADRSSSVFLHKDLPFFRCESFDGGMFLSYYLGRARYPETLQFSSSARPYLAYRESLELTRNYASSVIIFSDTGASRDKIDTEQDLITLLTDLQLSADLAHLRREFKKRYDVLVDRVQKDGLSLDELF